MRKAPLTPIRARKIARRFLPDDAFQHSERVALAVSRRACVAAWLHDVLEDGEVLSAPTLLERLENLGLNGPTRVAVLLLTRNEHMTYRDYIEEIALAQGEAGELAREVKLADLADNLARSGKRPTLRVRYMRAQRRLREGNHG